MQNKMKDYQAKISELKNKKAKLDTQISELQSDVDNISKQISDFANHIKQFYYDILLDAIIIGQTFKIRHGMTAPYVHGYKIFSDIINDKFCATISTSEKWWENLTSQLCDYLLNVKKWSDDNFMKLALETQDAWRQFPTTYDRNKYAPDKSYLHGKYIASGYETDGFAHILLGHCHGSWSSMTTNTQNQLSKELIILKGFGADYYLENQQEFSIPLPIVESVYRRHGLLKDNELLDTNWCNNHPDRCVW